MKKIIIGLSSLIILIFVIIFLSSGQKKPQEVKNNTIEISKDCAKCPSLATCDTTKIKK